MLEQNRPKIVTNEEVETCSKEKIEEMHTQLRKELCSTSQLQLAENRFDTYKSQVTTDLKRIHINVGKLEHKVSTNEHKIHLNMAKLMYNNVKIAGLVESKDEDPVRVVSTFFSNVMKIKPGKGDILEVTRMKGSLHRQIGGKQVEYPKLMFVRCLPHFWQLIEENKALLVGKHDELCKVPYGIKNHLPEAHYAVRQKFNNMVKNIVANNRGKPKKAQTRFHFKGEDFFVNGKKVVDKIHVPTMSELFSLTPTTRDTLHMIPLVRSDSVEERESKFQAFGVQVDSIRQVQNSYLLMKDEFMDATHISMGYCLMDNGERVYGALSDGEYQAEVKILEVLHRSQIVGIAVFVARWYGGVQLGRLRLSLVYQCVNKILDQFTYLKLIPEPEEEDNMETNDQEADSTKDSESDGHTSEPEDSSTPHHSSASQGKKKITAKTSKGRGRPRGRGGRGRGRGTTSRTTMMNVDFS